MLKKKLQRLMQTSQTPILPDGYTAVKCLLLYSGQYFDTGVTLTSEDSISIDMELDSNISESFAIMGCRDAYNSKNITISKQSSGYGICCDFNNGSGDTYRYKNDNFPSGRYTLYCNKNSRGIEGVGSNNAVCSDTFTCSAPCYVGYWGNGYTNYALIGAVYSATIEGKWNGIPCYRNSDFIFGFYDTYSQSFFTNAGVASPSAILLNPPIGYKQLDYIKTTGVQWFDTGITSSGKWRIDMNVRPTALTTNESQVWCGAYNGSNSKNFYVGKAGSSNWDIYHQYYTNSTYRIPYTQSTYPEIKAITAGGAGLGALYVFPNLTSSYTTSTNDQGITSYMFCRHINTGASNLPAKIDCFYNGRILDNNVVKRTYLPMIRVSDNVAGLYDLSNNTFKTSMTSTAFVAGSVIE